MKLSCEREKLLGAFQMVASVVPSRSPKAVLQNVKLEAKKERTTLMATDLELGIQTDLQGVDLEAPGTVLLPSARFGMILRESPEEKLHLSSEANRIRVWGERSEFYLPSENPDEYPDLPEFEGETSHQISARVLREMIRRTVFATDPESTRYALGGVFIEAGEDQITAVATDGRRLALQTGPAKVGKTPGPGNTIIPTRSMHLLERVLTDSEGEVLLVIRENDVQVKTQRALVESRLVEGRFPRWRDVFPRSEPRMSVEISVGPFLSAVRQSAIVTSEQHRGVDFLFGDGKVVLVAEGAEYGEARVEMPVAYDGEPVQITRDPRYLIEFLRVLEPEKTFTMSIRTSESPVVCNTDDGYRYLLMPLTRD